MNNFIDFRNFTEYFLKFKTHATKYFKQIFNHLSGEKGLHRLDFAKYLDKYFIK